MSYDWQQYIQMADELNQSPITLTVDTETCHRTAISRAYYGCFIQARNLLRDFDGYILPRGAEIHAFVIRELKTDGDGRRYRIGRNLSTLREYRNLVDYEDNAVNLPLLAQKSVQIARNIIADLNRISRKS
jgi:uncharacterized protein (UPF0332 family)